MSLKDDLQSARPGAVIEFRGKQVLGKLTGIRGTAAQPIRFVGADDTATLVPDRSYHAAVLRPESCAFLQGSRFALDGDGAADRCLQVFSDDCSFSDLETRGCRYDHVHTLGSRITVARVRSYMAGGEWLREGVGPHAGYAACRDGGGDVAGVTFTDWEVWDSLGAPWQGNGDGQTVRGLTLRRLRAHNWQDGFLVNLEDCASVVIEDLWGETDSGEVNGGVAAEGCSGVSVVRYHFVLPGGKPLFTGSIATTPGVPLPPSFDTAPAPAPQPPAPAPTPAPADDALREALAERDAARARVAELEGWQRRVREVVGA